AGDVDGDGAQFAAVAGIFVGVIAKDVLLGELGGDAAEGVVELAFVDWGVDRAAGLAGEFEHTALGRQLADICIAGAGTGADEIFEISCSDDVNLAVPELRFSKSVLKSGVGLCVVTVGDDHYHA